MSRIHTDHNGVAVNAISRTSAGAPVEGHLYQVIHGTTESTIQFQLGPVSLAGVNGLTNEALLAILIHRTKYLDHQFPCRENSIAITKMEEAAMWFDKRTRDRQHRGVEGKNEV